MIIRVRNKETGKIVEFDWQGKTPPTDEDIAKYESQNDSSNVAPHEMKMLGDIADTVTEYAPDVLKGAAESVGIPHDIEGVKKLFNPMDVMIKSIMGPLKPALDYGMNVKEQYPGIVNAIKSKTPGSSFEAGGRILATLAGQPGLVKAGEDIGSGDPHKMISGLAGGVTMAALPSLLNKVIKTANAKPSSESVPTTETTGKASLVDDMLKSPHEWDIQEGETYDQRNTRLDKYLDEIDAQNAAQDADPGIVHKDLIPPKESLPPQNELLSDEFTQDSLDAVPGLDEISRVIELADRAKAGDKSAIAQMAKETTELKQQINRLAKERGLPHPHKDVLGDRPENASERGAIGEAPIDEDLASLQTMFEKADPVDKLLDRLKGAKPARDIQEQIYTHGKAEKFAEARKAEGLQGEDWLNAAKGALKGEHPKIKFEPIELTDADRVELFNKARDAEGLDTPEKIRTGIALSKLLIGEVPQHNELALIEKVYGGDLVNEILNKRGTGQKVLDFAGQVPDIARALSSSFDLSAVLRQGKILTINHPIKAFGAFVDSLHGMVNPKFYQGMLDEIKSRPNADLYKRTNLYLADLSKFGTREEQFSSRIADKIPGIAASGRQFSGFLNKLRADVFDSEAAALDKAGYDPKTNFQMYESLANFINLSTGRGSLGKLSAAAPILNWAAFSPRFQASRLALLNLMTYTKMPGPVRIMALKNMATMIGFNATLMGLAKIFNKDAEVEEDPRSSNFALLKINNSVLDTWAGLQSWVKLFAQLRLDKLGTGFFSDDKHAFDAERVTKTGKLTNPSRYDLLEQFLRGKAAPAPAIIIDWLKGTTMAGKKTDWYTTAAHFVPMFIQDIIDMYGTSTTPKEGAEPAFLLPALLGESNRYMEQPEKGLR